MTDKPSQTTAEDARRERLAEALRANLARRKAQARSRRGGGSEVVPAEQAEPTERGDGQPD